MRQSGMVMGGYCYSIVARWRGRFKVYRVFQQADHIMDWAGCNYRVAPAAAQTAKGFGTAKEANRWRLKNIKTLTRRQLEDEVYDKNGSSFADAFTKTRWVYACDECAFVDTTPKLALPRLDDPLYRHVQKAHRK